MTEKSSRHAAPAPAVVRDETSRACWRCAIRQGFPAVRCVSRRRRGRGGGGGHRLSNFCRPRGLLYSAEVLPRLCLARIAHHRSTCVCSDARTSVAVLIEKSRRIAVRQAISRVNPPAKTRLSPYRPLLLRGCKTARGAPFWTGPGRLILLVPSSFCGHDRHDRNEPWSHTDTVMALEVTVTQLFKDEKNGFVYITVPIVLRWSLSSTL